MNKYVQNSVFSIFQVSVDGNTTISTLHYKPSINENNKSLKCRSENPNLPGSVIERCSELFIFGF